MYNEILFLIHLLLLVLSSLAALELGATVLIALITVQSVLMNFFVTKQVALFGFSATATDAYALGITLGLNLLQEYFGRSTALGTIFISFGISLFATMMGQIHLWYTPSIYDTHHAHAFALLATMPRIMLASCISYLTCQYVDYLLYAALKRFFNGRFLGARLSISLATTQLLDTVLFSVLGLYGIVNNLISVILISYIIKVIGITILVPSVIFLLDFIKRRS